MKRTKGPCPACDIQGPVENALYGAHIEALRAAHDIGRIYLDLLAQALDRVQQRAVRFLS